MQGADAFVPTLQRWIESYTDHSISNLICFSRKSGLSMSQLGALFYVHRVGTTSVTELGDHLCVTSGAASQILDRLVRQKLIQRTEDPNDRRAKRIVLTEKGLEMLHQSTCAQHRWVNDLERFLSEPEKASVVAALDVLMDKITHLHSQSRELNVNG